MNDDATKETTAAARNDGEATMRETPQARAARGDAIDPVLEALWGRVLEGWDDDKSHHALLEYAITAQKLSDVAGLYRGVKERDGAKAARAQKKLDGIVIAATQMLMTMKTPERTKVPTLITITAFFVCLLLIGWVTYLVFHRG